MRKVARKLSRSVYPICLGLAAICALVVGSPRTVTATPVIVTTQGRLTGISTAGEDLYLGIPYAAPPVGELRWRPPHSPAHFKGVFKATQFGSPCVQPNGTGGTIVIFSSLSTYSSVTSTRAFASAPSGSRRMFPPMAQPSTTCAAYLISPTDGPAHRLYFPAESKASARGRTLVSLCFTSWAL
jgi:carboxylesterase family protein